jgi:hypothetical protein
VCRLQLLLVLASAVILRSEFRGTHYHILLSEIRDSPNLEGQAPVFISPRNRVVQLYPQVLGSLSVVSYDSQSYGGGIRTRLTSASCLKDKSSARTTQKTQLYCCRGVFTAPLHSKVRGADHIENTVLLLSRACMLRALPNNAVVYRVTAYQRVYTPQYYVGATILVSRPALGPFYTIGSGGTSVMCKVTGIWSWPLTLI